MLPVVLIDPSMLWLLHCDDPLSDEALDIIQRSVKWYTGVLSPKLKTYVVRLALEDLARRNLFPAEEYISALLRAHALHNVVSAKQIASNIARFLATCRFVEDDFAIRDALLSEHAAQQVLFYDIGDIDLGYLSVLNASISALISHRDGPDGVPILIAYARKAHVNSNVRFEYEAVEPDLYWPVAKDGFEAALPVAADPSELGSAFDPAVLWRSANNADEIAFAIQCAASRMAKEKGIVPRKVHVGPSFYADLVTHNAAGDGNAAALVLSKCAQVAATAVGERYPDFRVSSAAAAPARSRRSGCQARRIHVTESHEALRLMFWESRTGDVQFASLRTKFDIYIDERQ